MSSMPSTSVLKKALSPIDTSGVASDRSRPEQTQGQTLRLGAGPSRRERGGAEASRRASSPKRPWSARVVGSRLEDAVRRRCLA
eukprot:scaffold141545_cov136-Phaeocystis_antarctica.AAC.1